MKTDLTKVSTKQLSEELAKREGITEVWVHPYEVIRIETVDGLVIDDTGPMQLLINID